MYIYIYAMFSTHPFKALKHSESVQARWLVHVHRGVPSFKIRL